MIKLLLIVAILIVSVLIGLAIRNYFYTRVQIFGDFKDVFQTLKSEICFLKSEKNSILLKVDCKSKQTSEFLAEYIKNGNGSCSFLKNDESRELNNFLNSVGQYDVGGEISNLDYVELKINKYCDIASENLNKYGSFSIKMAIVFGTLIAIILI